MGVHAVLPISEKESHESENRTGHHEKQCQQAWKLLEMHSRALQNLHKTFLLL